MLFSEIPSRSRFVSLLPTQIIILFFVFLSSNSYSQELESLASVDSIESLFLKESDTKVKLKLLNELVEEAASLKAESYFELCPKLESYAENLEDDYALATINKIRGEQLYRESRYSDAAEYFIVAVELFESIGNQKDAYLSKIKSGLMFEQTGKSEEAFQIFNDVLDSSQHDSLLQVRGEAYLQLGSHYYNRRNIDSSGLYYENALEVFEQTFDSLRITACLNNLAINYYMKGEVDRSEEAFLRLKSLHEAKGNKPRLVMVLNNLALFNLELARNEQALTYAKEAYGLAIDTDDKNFLVNILTTIGNIYLQTGEYESAYNFIVKVEEEVPEVKYDGRVIVLGLKGQILKGLGRYEEAVEAFNESIKIVSEKKVQVQREVEMKSHLALALFEIGDIAEAKKIINELQSKEIESPLLATEVDFTKIKLLYHELDYFGVINLGEPTYQKLETYKKTQLSYKLSEMLSTAYEQTNNYQKALAYSRKYQILNDSLNNVEQVKLLTQNTKDFEFELEKQNLAAERAKEEAILEEEALRSKILAGSIGFVAMLISFFFYKNNQQKKLIAENNSSLKALNKTKDQIFSIIGHDLKKPVLAFRGLHDKFSYLIENNDYEKLLKFSKSIDNDAIQLNKLTDNLLSWALLERDVLTTNSESINLKEIVVEVVRLFQPFAEKKSIKFDYQIENIVVKSDRHALSTIIRNLVDNAIKYTPEEGTVKLYTVQDGNRIQLSVQDSGIGIPEEKINDLFLPAMGKSTEGTNEEKGTGLGLHIVEELAKKVNGSIKVNSRIDEGSLFTLSIPVTA